MRPAWQVWVLNLHGVNRRVIRYFSGSLPRSICPTSVTSKHHEQPAKEANKILKEESKQQRAVAFSRELFSLDKSSPGSPLFHPFGTHIFQKLQAFLRAQYPTYGFQEVLSPTIYKKSLWETSGHWENYKNDMFAVTGRGAQGVDDSKREIGVDEEYGLKPMNCPGHCLLFRSQKRSYKDLPIRYADFSPLHRNEVSGALGGLTRLRRFHQDDGHIFCRRSQLQNEISRTLSFVRLTYHTLNLGDYKLRLGTRPDHFIGTVDEWETAEAHLKLALEESGRPYYVNRGDGAFYGPKIDIVITDADGKDHQTATTQLDFQLPKRFKLEVDGPGSNQKETPVLIHRAVLGSLERFIALLMDSHRGKWPFWLSPRQMIILTVGQSLGVRERAGEIARQLTSPDGRPGAQTLEARRFMVDCDNSDETIAKKVLNARKNGYSFYAVFGERNLKPSPDKQTIDINLASHPNEQAMREALYAFLQPRTPNKCSDTAAQPTTANVTTASLTVQQCQELMTNLVSRYL
ncbi:MAG: hypothetical protein Q9207_002409 [Kuettlingeria erythrocarpa]